MLSQGADTSRARLRNPRTGLKNREGAVDNGCEGDRSRVEGCPKKETPKWAAKRDTRPVRLGKATAQVETIGQPARGSYLKSVGVQ